MSYYEKKEIILFVLNKRVFKLKDTRLKSSYTLQQVTYMHFSRIYLLRCFLKFTLNKKVLFLQIIFILSYEVHQGYMQKSVLIRTLTEF